MTLFDKIFQWYPIVIWVLVAVNLACWVTRFADLTIHK